MTSRVLGLLLFAALLAACSGTPDNGGGSTGGPLIVGGSSTGGTGSADAGPCAIGDDRYCVQPSGKPGLCCGGSCVDRTSDPNHCGRCTNVCQTGETCAGARCLIERCGSVDAGDPCLEDDGGTGTCCGTTCSSLDADPENCGGCGVTCGPGQLCANTLCTLANCANADAGGADCAIGGGQAGVCCEGACVDPLSASTDCGMCGISCAVGETCTNGICASSFVIGCTSSPCQPGSSCSAQDVCVLNGCSEMTEASACLASDGTQGTCCGGTCVATRSSRTDCGSCGNACPVGQTCTGGACVAGGACDGQPSGASCAVAGTLGSCCGGTCVDTSADARNCGGCGVACQVGDVCGLFCIHPDGGMSGSCTADNCPAGYGCDPILGNCVILSCPAESDGEGCIFGSGLPNGPTGLCCGGACRAKDDPLNCGGCGVACESGVCVDGTCLPAPDAGATCGTCAAGKTCASGVCVDTGCSAHQNVVDEPCALGGAAVGSCCAYPGGSSCRDLANDPANCGHCDYACPAGQTCAHGACSGAGASCGTAALGQRCGDGGANQACCVDGCADILSANTDCGQCGHACLSGESCEGGHCVVASCGGSDFEYCAPDGGQSVCCGSSCSDLASDPQNCGTCGVVCDGGGCALFQCALATCTTGTQDQTCVAASGAPGTCCGGGCAETFIDPFNCGGCGIVCAITSPCVGGVCLQF
ncbi:MAG: hypothetical protein JST54_31570 [Deltaproteobacteria bacterium]|nr:hypothetical protein [Deltaproteobacteria bacterium]